MDHENEITQKVADWVVQDLKVAYDYTIRDPNELQSAFVGKQKKYGTIYFDNQSIQ